MKNKSTLLTLFLSLIFITATEAAAIGDFRSAGSGDWSSPTTWEQFNGTSWVIATFSPSSADGVITILTGDSVTVTNNLDTTFADQVIVDTGAVLNIKSAIFYLRNGKGTDLIVNGKLMVDFNSNIQNKSNGKGQPATIDYMGDSIIQNGGLSAAISFNGINQQTIIGSGYFNGLVTVNNGNNLIVANSTSFGQTTFLNGKIIVSGFFVISQYGGTFKGASNTRFIDGKVIFIMYEPTVFSISIPLGKGDDYFPVVFTSEKNDAIETHYTFSPFDGTPPVLSLPSSIDRIYASKYINITSDNPSSLVSASLQLSYDSSDEVTDTSRLRIVKSEGSSWINLGGRGRGLPSGKITSSVNFDILGDFALANQSAGKLQLNSSVSSANIKGSEIYKLTTNADGKITLNLTSKNNNSLSLILLDGDRKTSLTTLNVNANATGMISKNGLAEGVYYIKISPFSKSQIYSYTLSNNLSTPLQANNIEPDSTKALSQTLLLNGQTTGHIGYYYNNRRDTFDWYKIVVDTSGFLKLWLTSANANSVSLTLFDKNGITILGTLKVSGNTTDTLKIALAKGKYYLAIMSSKIDLFEPYILGNSLIPDFIYSRKPILPIKENFSIKAKKNVSIEDITVFPNPSDVQIHLHLNGITARIDNYVSLSLKDMNGKIIWSLAKIKTSSLKDFSIDVSKFSTGIYFLQVTDETNQAISKRVIISR